MEIICYDSSFDYEMYELFVLFQKEEDFYLEHTFEEFRNRLLDNPSFQKENTFLCIENGYLLGYISSFIGDSKSGYIHTFIVRKEYRRKGIGSILLEKVENRFKEEGKESSRLVFLSPINWPWKIKHTGGHIHPGCPAVIINSEYYIFLYHHGYFVNSIHEGFHLNLSDYKLSEKLEIRKKENEENGLVVELYDKNKHFGIDEFCEEIQNIGFASSIKRNLEREEPYPFVVASLNGRVVGWTGAIYTEKSGRGHLDGIAVSPSVRGRGVGTLVFAKLCEESKKNGAKYMTFFTGLDNNARYIYLGAGFNVACSFADMKKKL